MFWFKQFFSLLVSFFYFSLSVVNRFLMDNCMDYYIYVNGFSCSQWDDLEIHL